ncbi:sigma-70 family RNA polymerase sigma factor [Corynebacterium dentalis]|uniref:sigma-70 family RNA polymerase sigma factor n=1 Tax=Corynebacterium dentalis TaxID=2014528 RepID=UPI001359E820|nr:sigma-70 family RNA polymerase sigma factor [Corynebacterium dentalis]
MDRTAQPLRPPEELIAETSLGKRDAFSELYDTFSSLVFGIILKVTMNREIAQETTQDVWLEIWQKASHFDHNRGSVKSWIARIAHGRAVDAVRNHEASRRRQETFGNKEAATVAPPVTEGVERQEENTEVSLCLDALTELQRESVFLAYYSGLTQKEIAQRTGAGLSAVKTRIRDGMLALRRCMSA